MTETLEQPAQIAPSLAEADSPRLTPLQPGRDAPPAITPGNLEISITITQDGHAPLRLTFRTPGQEASIPAVAPQAETQTTTEAVAAEAAATSAAIAPAPAPINITQTHIAGTGISLAALLPATTAAPSSIIALNNVLATRSEQMERATRLLNVHEAIDKASQEAFSAQLQSINPEIFKQATQIVHQVMAELLSGNIIMEVPADQIMAIRDHMIDQALLEAKNHGNKGNFNPTALKESITSSGPVLKFKQSYHSAHKHASTVHYHPDHAEKKHADAAAAASKALHQGRLLQPTPATELAGVAG